MTSAITAIGTANPVYKQSQQVAADIVIEALNLSASEKRLIKSIYRATGIDERYSVVSDFTKPLSEYVFFPNDPVSPFPSTGKRMEKYKEQALPLALNAIKQCLSQADDDFDPMSITHVITVSCTGMYAPGLDIEIVQCLHLNSNVKRTTINFMGCYGAFNAIKVADAFCRADENAKVLVVCIELCTIHLQKNTSMDSMLANAIFSDGAAAVLIEAKSANKKQFLLEHFHCDLLAQTHDDMAWHIADNGFDIVLSSYVPDVIESGIAKFTNRMLNANSMTLNDIDFFAIHPGGVKILKACEEALSITKEDNRFSYHVLKHYGNMSSVTILFVLNEIWKKIDKNDTNKKIFSCAFGPGLTLESMILKVAN